MATVEVNGYTIEPGADLSGAELKGANLAGADLTRGLSRVKDPPAGVIFE